MITYHSIQDILELCEKEQMTFAQVIERADMEERAVTQEASYAKMQSMYEAMRHADATYDAKLTSASGLVGGDGEKLRAYNEAGKNLCGDFLGLVMEKAIKMAEGNACMRRIVAAPTAGSCGVIPAVFLTAQEKLACTEEQMVAAMYISAGVGCRHCGKCFDCRRVWRLSGRNWFCICDGRSRAMLPTGWHECDDRKCSRAGAEKHARTCV